MPETSITFEELASLVDVTVDDLRTWQEFELVHADGDGRFDGDAVDRARPLRFIDEFKLVFPSATSAVTCGLDIARRAGQETQFPATRMGAHSGTGLFREADYLGATVNIAARVEGGQFLVSDAVRSDVIGLVGSRFRSAGSRKLKGVAEPIELFVVGDSGMPDERTVDPVCGMVLDEQRCDVRPVWQGQDLYFCSDRCRELFVESPDRHTLPE